LILEARWVPHLCPVSWPSASAPHHWCCWVPSERPAPRGPRKGRATSPTEVIERDKSHLLGNHDCIASSGFRSLSLLRLRRKERRLSSPSSVLLSLRNRTSGSARAALMSSLSFTSNASSWVGVPSVVLYVHTHITQPAY
jgi:hypothetical protein